MADLFGFGAPQSKFQQNANPMQLLAAAPTVLFPQQLAALNSLVPYFAQHPNPALICMPTGTGKSGVIAFMPYFLAATRPIRNVLIVTPSKDTQKQLYNDLGNPLHPDRKFLSKAAQRANTIIPRPSFPSVIKTSGPLLNDNVFTNEITVSNAQAFHQNANALWRQLPPDGYQLVIIDEAHHFPSSFWTSVITFFGQAALVVFCTATPFRADGQTVIANLIPPAYHLSRANAIQSGLIRDTALVSLQTNYTSEVIANQFKYSLTNIQVDVWDAILTTVRERLQERNQNNAFPVVAQNTPPQRHRAIAVALNVEQADDIRKRAVATGLHPVVYHSSISKAARYQNKTMFEQEDSPTNLLIICGMLLEGYDFPPISVCAIMENLVSPVKFSQFIGRAIRRVRTGNAVDQYNALIITHDYYAQQNNYNNYTNETLINNALGQQQGLPLAPLPPNPQLLLQPPQ